MWRYLLLALGCLTLTLLVWHIGPEKIYAAAARVGPGAVFAILVPSLLMYAFEAYGWKLTLGSAANGIPFLKIFLRDWTTEFIEVWPFLVSINDYKAFIITRILEVATTGGPPNGRPLKWSLYPCIGYFPVFG